MQCGIETVPCSLPLALSRAGHCHPIWLIWGCGLPVCLFSRSNLFKRCRLPERWEEDAIYYWRHIEMGVKISTAKLYLKPSFISTLQTGLSCDMIRNIPAYFLKYPFFCSMWVGLLIFLLFDSHLYRSLLPSQPSKQSTAVRQSKLWERTKTHSPEGPPSWTRWAEASVSWSRGLLPFSAPRFVLTSPCHSFQAHISVLLFPSPFPSVLGLVWVFTGWPGWGWGCCWVNLRLRGNSSSY